MSKFKPFFIVTAALLISGCASVSTHTTMRAPKERSLKELCRKNNITWRWDSISQVMTMRKGDVHASILVGSPIVLIGEEKIILSKAVRTVKSVIVVPDDFSSRVLERFDVLDVPDTRYRISSVKNIIVDAGHGGKDPGAIGRSGLKEKTVVLDIAKKLEGLLKAKGYKVSMIRSSDRFVTLKKRTQMAAKADADLFISIHANASPSRSVHGMEVYSAKALGYKEKNEAVREGNANKLLSQLKMERDHDLNKIITDLMDTHKQSESNHLARHVSKSASKFIKAKNRGQKHAGFFVLRNTLIPAILVEVGFLTNPKEERLLKTSAYRQKVARGLAQAITSYAQN